ncbi:ParB/RepB/Spo0J family partition protein [Vibrio sp. SS-MA-C1-2]|uniref:ParB/RepB/Spo0J family partition protein n=1 Tax=Vibrio sp. SS-MA-C1-2 TaxID=2908646 RepID=UPI001F40952E|nr:ParB/RepB/Spo0J family partition protein [Vibrio sp. SS-MA-C1-2]UJF16863.1 ParB/RepB/Spo0J family partition protein [Vibrio sp. SS-MA-C1-2]
MAIKTADLNARLFGKTNKRKATTPAEAQQAVQDKASVIELAIAGEQSVGFELITVKADEIANKTTVFAENAREQAFLNEHALADILVTLKDKGQQYPAIGRWLDDGTIEVLDGSRRRMSCILSHNDFLIYVAKGITTKHAKFLSDVANAHKPLSLFERGKEMQSMLDRGDVIDQKQLAKVFQCNEAIVSGALKAAALPLALLKAYPSVAELGRPTMVRLHKLYYSLTQEQQAQLIDQLQEREQPFWHYVDVQGISRMTREVTQRIEYFIESLQPSEPQTTTKTSQLISGRANYHRQGSNLNLNLKQVNDQQMSQILAYVKDLLH